MHNLSRPLSAVLFLWGVLLSLAGCRPECYDLPESPVYWSKETEIVKLHGPLAVTNVYAQFIADSAWVQLSIVRPESKRDHSGRRLEIFLEGGSQYSAKDIRLKCGKTYLQVNGHPVQRIVPSDCDDHACRIKIKKGGTFHESWATLAFDMKHLDSVQLATTPIVIRLDSVLEYDKHVVDLGRIEMSNFWADTAEYIL